MTMATRRLITYDEAQEMLGGGPSKPISRSTLQRLIRAGEIEVITIAERVRRIDAASVERYLRSL